VLVVFGCCVFKCVASTGHRTCFLSASSGLAEFFVGWFVLCFGFGHRSQNSFFGSVRGVAANFFLGDFLEAGG
jgi:hypothetical protein